MSTKKEILYLLQVAIPFAILGWMKTHYFFILCAVIILSLPFDYLRKRLIQIWQNLGHLLGNIVSPIVMSFIYYAGLTPLALIRKLFGADELNLKKPEKSTLTEVNMKASTDSFEDLW
ncbi:MAG: hypothetical protein K2P81_05945 [Bacteriovoracaceae bacterium]|nr:hypothetical protein [Bacteriovoracaceae bacterium]